MRVYDVGGNSFHGELSKYSGLPERPRFPGGLDIQGVYIYIYT